jgi:hypothetical protein
MVPQVTHLKREQEADNIGHQGRHAERYQDQRYAAKVYQHRANTHDSKPQ